MSNTPLADSSESQTIRDEIADLESRLRDANARLKSVESSEVGQSPSKVLHSNGRIQGPRLLQ